MFARFRTLALAGLAGAAVFAALAVTAALWRIGVLNELLRMV